MGNNEKYVTMINHHLSKLRNPESSHGMGIHWYEKGDESVWVYINGAADKYNNITKNLFFNQFDDESLVLKERQCYLVESSGKLFATGTAWEGTEGEYIGYGRPHWIAVLPEYQGKGYGKLLMSIVCNRLVSFGYKKAYLTTSTLRPEAIALYEKSGFEIVSIKDPNEY
jgi:GNAT superfamily N-acetyltransferase